MYLVPRKNMELSKREEGRSRFQVGGVLRVADEEAGAFADVEAAFGGNDVGGKRSEAGEAFFSEAIGRGDVVDQRLNFGNVQGVFVFGDPDGAKVGGHLILAVF